MESNRRDFIKKSVLGATALSVGGVLPGFSASGYRNIIGANDRINICVVGVNSRGLALAGNYAQQKNCNVITISDTDSRAMEKCIASVKVIAGKAPR